jgi:hypothetical protein
MMVEKGVVYRVKGRGFFDEKDQSDGAVDRRRGKTCYDGIHEF